MNREYHHWHSPRLGLEIGVVVYGHWGPPLVGFPTSAGAREDAGPSYRLSEVLARRGIRHSLENWGPEGGHDWPFWKHQMRKYISDLH